MLSKEECEKALDVLKEQHDYLCFNMRNNYPYSIEMIKMVQDCFEQLIEEHFELVETLKEVGWSGFGLDELKTIIKAGQYNAEKLNSLRNPQPYKFEDLKEGMWVYDNIYKSVFQIQEISKNKKVKVYNYGWIGAFEENRFFPLNAINWMTED